MKYKLGTMGDAFATFVLWFMASLYMLVVPGSAVFFGFMVITFFVTWGCYLSFKKEAGR
jgi:hypothetical protein